MYWNYVFISVVPSSKNVGKLGIIGFAISADLYCLITVAGRHQDMDITAVIDAKDN